MSGLAGDRARQFHIQHGFAAFIDRAIEFDEAGRHIRQHFAQCAADMGFHRQAVDLRQALVDANEAVFPVHQDEADRRILVDLLDLGQLLPYVAMEPLDLLFGLFWLGRLVRCGKRIIWLAQGGRLWFVKPNAPPPLSLDV